MLQDPNLLQTTQIVLTLAHPLQGHNHHIITDRFYSSPELASELDKRGLAFTGTVQVNRRGMPQAIKGGGKMRHGCVRAYRCGKLMALQWLDKRPITMLSTTESCKMVQVQTRRGQTKEKPKVVQLYNENMMGVDRLDQMATYYSFLHKSVQCMFWLLEVSVVNAYYILQNTRLINLQQQPLTHLQFLSALVQGLVSHQLQVPQLICPGRQVDMSLERMRPIPHFSEQGDTRRDYRVCSTSGKRRATTFFCFKCSDHSHLHPGKCFRLYHTRVNYRPRT